MYLHCSNRNNVKYVKYVNYFVFSVTKQTNKQKRNENIKRNMYSVLYFLTVICS